MASIKNYRIVIAADATFNELRAADIVARHVRLIVGVTPEIVRDDTDPAECEIVVGRTSREALDGFKLSRDESREFDFLIKLVGKRLYLVGLGADQQYKNEPFRSYVYINDGEYGTVLAAEHFVENVLGCEIVFTQYDGFKTLDDVEIDASAEYDYTRERFEAELPPHVDGTAMYSIPSSNLIAQDCTVLKTERGTLVVIDGGRHGQAEHIVRCLEALSDGKPVIEAWMLSHLHKDHYGVLYDIICDEKMRERVLVKNFYHHLLPLDYYIEKAPDKEAVFEEVLERLYSMPEVWGTALHSVEAGEHITVEELDFKVVRIPVLREGERIMGLNDTSVIYKLFAHGQSILFLGDAEQRCDSDLFKYHSEDLKSDVMKIPHHGNGNVSKKCYAAIAPKLFLFQTCERDWYSDGGEGQSTRNIGMIRTHYFIKSLGTPSSCILRDSKGLLAFKLPIENI